MVLEVGDLWPQSSGSASLGAEMTNGGLAREAQPFASIHQNSGVYYSPFGTSGVLRYTAGKEVIQAGTDAFGIYKGFEISVDGGRKFIVKVGGTQGTGTLIPAGAAIIEALGESQLRLVGSGIKLDSGRQLALEAWGASGRLDYRFGPRQSWYMKTGISSTGGPFNDGYWPIAHSGNVAQMIGQAKFFNSASGVTVLGGTSTNAEGVEEDGTLQPFASVHLNSGIFHGPYGSSGIIRYNSDTRPTLSEFAIVRGDHMEFSVDGGISFPIGIGRFSVFGTFFHVIETLDNTRLSILGSGITLASVGNTLDIVNIRNNINLLTQEVGGIVLNSIEEVLISSDLHPGNILFDRGISLITNYANIAFRAGVVGANVGDILLDSWASSGMMCYRFGPHQSWHMKTSHSSTDGPADDGYWPIPHSGNVAQMIAEGVVSPKGNIVPSFSGVSHIGYEHQNAFQPYATIHQMSGVWHSSYGGSGIIRFEDKAFGLSVDGGVAYNLLFQENLASNYGALVHAPIGQLRLVGNTGARLEATDGNIVIHAVEGNITLDSSGLGTAILSIFSDDIMNIDAEGPLAIDSASLQIGCTDLILGTTEGDVIMIIAGGAIIDTQGDILLDSWTGSGTLRYRFGPHQSWHMKTSHSSTGGPSNDGYWPIAHSGNVSQMIADKSVSIGSGLQSAYQTRRLAVLTSNPGDLQFISNTAKTEFSTFGTQAELNISGLFLPPTLSNLERGDLFMMNHSIISGIVGTTTDAVVKAKALGVGTLVINTGSGIANVSIGSGIAMFSNSALMQITLVAQNVPLNTILESADQNYGLGTGANSGVITVFSPGLYKISYKITNSKTVGTVAQDCIARLDLNNSGSNIFGSVINTIHINNTIASDNTASTVLLLNMNAGDNIRMKVNSSADGLQNCNVIARGATLIIEKIGPQRGAAGS